MIDRETVIQRSVESYLRAQLFDARSYPTDKVILLDAYPDNQRMLRPIDLNYIAIGWLADDGGRYAELGSPAKVRKFTFDFYIFGTSRVWAHNLASVLRYSLETDGIIPLLDPATQEPFDYVDVDFASSQQVLTNNPRPWQENHWITRLRVIDNYYSAAGGG